MPKRRTDLSLDVIDKAVILCFFLTGCTGLAYEVVWSRQLALTFGAAAPSVGIVLASFMLGLGLGSLIVGQWADRLKRPLVAYAIIEGVIGVYALLFTLILKQVDSIYFQLFAVQFPGLTFIRIGLIFLLLLLPTFLMGGTLPLLSRYWIKKREQVHYGVGFLYGINTFGAVLGAFLSGYFLIASIGLAMTINIAAFINLLVMMISLSIGLGTPDQASIKSQQIRQENERLKQLSATSNSEYSQVRLFLLFMLYGFSGFSALAYEVCWTRLISVILGNNAYGLTAVLTAFLAGIASGGALAARYGNRIGCKIFTFYRFQVFIALSSLLIIVVIPQIPLLIGGIYKAYGFSFWLFNVMQLVLIFFILLLPTFCFGFIYPLIVDIITTRVVHLGTSIGKINLSNTFGATFGSLTMTFIFIPGIGLDHSLYLLAIINILIGLGILAIGRVRIMKWREVVIYSMSFMIALLLIWGLKSNTIEQILHGRIPIDWNILAVVEDVEGTVAVVEGPERPATKLVRRLYINGNPSASALKGPLQLEIFEGLLPISLHPKPEDILIIGLGTGITAGAVADYPGLNIDALEIISRIKEITSYFKNENLSILEHPRFNLFIEDGRQYLARTKKMYDVITTAPQHPAQVGSVHLYTEDYFQLCFDHLRADGLMAQWVPLYQLSKYDVRRIIFTMRQIFPVLSLWIINKDIIILGKKTYEPINFSNLEQKFRIPAFARAMRRIDVNNPYALFGLFHSTGAALQLENSRKNIISDDYPQLEFSSLRTVNNDTVPENLTYFINLVEHVHSEIPGFIQWRGEPEEA
ncbi:fused MFS/spermidine synthase, partial [candidate division CSSED10-310 bacterium]